MTGCKVLGTLPKFYFVGVQLRIFEAWLQILGAPISKLSAPRRVFTQASYLQYGPTLEVFNTLNTIK